MGRPRKDNPETSARSAGGQNTGVDGARHAAADDVTAAAASAEPALNEEVAPVNEEIADTRAAAGAGDDGTGAGRTGHEPGDSEQPGDTGQPGDTEPGDSGPGDSGYDETSGIVYEVQPRGLEIFGLKSAADEDPPGSAPAAPAGSAASGSGTPAPDSGTPPAPDPGAPAEPPTVEQTAVGDTGSRPAPSPAVAAASQPPRAERSQPPQGERGSRDNPFGKILGRLSGAAPGDGEPPLTRFRNLPLDQKMRIWRIRALIVVGVGVLFSLIFNWQIGLTLAIIAGIADTIYRTRSVEAHAWAQPGTVDRATLRAQKRTIKQLAAMERAGYLALHRRPIPDSEEVIDHLVVGPTGVYAIDSEKWNKELPIRQSNGQKLWLGPENKNKRLDHAHWEAGQASERLSAKLGMEVKVQPALAIYGPKISWVVLDVRGVDVFSGSELKQYLRRRARRKGLPRLTDEEIRKIYKAAGGVLPLEWQNSMTPVG